MDLLPIFSLVLSCPVFSVLLLRRVLPGKRKTPAHKVFYILFACEFIALFVFVAFLFIGNPAGIGIDTEQHVAILGYSGIAIIVFFIAELIIYLTLIRKHQPHK